MAMHNDIINELVIFQLLDQFVTKIGSGKSSDIAQTLDSVRYVLMICYLCLKYL